MEIDLGFTVKKSDAEKNDTAVATHNGTIKAGVRAMLFARALQLEKQFEGGRNQAITAVFSEFWKQWKAL